MTPEDDLLDKARALPRAVPPARDLWPGIAARLEDTGSAPSADAAIAATLAPSRPSLRRWQTPALAAGLLLAATLAIWLGRDSTTTVHTSAGVHSIGHLQMAGLHQNRLALAGSIERHLTELSPATRVVVLENLATINGALDEIDAALAAAPASGLDARLLMAVYADQLVLLNAMNNTMYNTMNNTMNTAGYAATPEITL